MRKISKNVKETEKIAKAFLGKVGPKKFGATVIGLYGNLGTGKTTFVQYLAKELGVKKKVNSPTFVIMKKYLLPKRGTRQKFSPAGTGFVLPARKFLPGLPFKLLFHIDAYRLKNEKELAHLGWEEIIGNKEHLVFIEWPENVIRSLPKKHHQIHIAHTKEGYRRFQIKKG
jgi:tRNA threonylcarbamoyladenosine biosynthesis protein TsaE